MTTQLTAEIEPFRLSNSNPASSANSAEDSDSLACLTRSDSGQGACTLSNPSKDGLDFQRCAALHNAIVRHGWVSRGHELADLPPRTYWDRWEPTLTPYQFESLQESLHSSVLAFLQHALELPDFYPGSFQPPVFFYHLVGLNAPLELFANHEEIEGDRYVTLYSLQDVLATEGKLPDGLVYDQVQHRCVLIKDVEEGLALSLEERQLAWEPLETFLTTYCEMIEADKVVALPKTVKGPESFEYVRNPAGGYAMRSIPDEELRDPRTGARRTKKCFDPWVMVPYTSADVEIALAAWDCLVGAIESRLTQPPCQKPHECRERLYSLKTLRRAGLRQDSFAFSFLSRAPKPAFKNVAPGLRLLTAQEFERQPFQDVVLGVTCSTPPVLLLRGDPAAGKEQALDLGRGTTASLYLKSCNADEAFPFENVVKITGPCRDLSLKQDLEVDELGVFPRAQLLHIVLERFSDLIESGQWTVGPDGVEGSVVEPDKL
ncbi:hypothetical protein PRZ48_013080 [Zasmidium cellare]|uniref:Uncharacterized protein n=1 Tax=Zasmidium cellare TaxID=395010 RepID=A0ABR0E313_ZASCE|nr:hypothetical protein PRZ48_013080 [Zasmidium cellare]